MKDKDVKFLLLGMCLTVIIIAILLTICTYTSSMKSEDTETELPLGYVSSLNFEDLLDSLEYVESRGDPNAVGDYEIVKYSSIPQWSYPLKKYGKGKVLVYYDDDDDNFYEAQGIGAYQIHKDYVDDCNKIAGGDSSWASNNTYTYGDRWNRDKSREMTWLYLDYYSKKVINSDPQLLNYCPQIKWFELMARIHNGGPNGWKKESTKEYWLKVKARMERN